MAKSLLVTAACLPSVHTCVGVELSGDVHSQASDLLSKSWPIALSARGEGSDVDPAPVYHLVNADVTTDAAVAEWTQAGV